MTAAGASLGRTGAVGLIGLLLLATLGRGGDAPPLLLAWHGLLVLLVILAGLGPRSPQSRRRRLARAPAAALAFFVGWAWIAACFVPFGYAAWLLLLELGTFVAVAWLAARRGADWLDSLAPALWVAAVAQCLLASWQVWGLGEPRPAGSFLNPNHLAGWLVAVLLVGLGWWLAGGAAPRRLAAGGALAAPLVLVLWLCASRGALLGLTAGGGCLALVFWKRLSRRWRAGLLGGVVLLLVLGLTAQLRRLDEPDPFRYQRVRIWSQSLQPVLESPWIGAGPRQFGPASRNLQFPDGHGPLRFDRTFSFPHSDLIRLPAEFGWPGLVAALVALWLTWRRLRRRASCGGLHGSAAGAAAALVALLAQALVDHPSHRPGLYLLAAAFWGALLSEPAEPAPRTGAVRRAGAVALLLVAFAVGDVAPFLSWRATRDLPQGRLSEAQQSRLQAALRWNPVHPDPWLRRAEHLASIPGWQVADYAAAREAAERAMRLQAADARYALGLARVERQACGTLFPDEATRERAAAAYRRAEALSRFDPRIPTELAGFLLDTGDPSGARAAARRALELEPESVMPRLILADAWLASGESGGRRRARKLIAEAEERSRKWAHWRERSGYARVFLTLDPRDLERARRRLAAGERAGEDSTSDAEDPYIGSREGDVER